MAIDLFVGGQNWLTELWTSSKATYWVSNTWTLCKQLYFLSKQEVNKVTGQLQFHD